MFYVVKWLYSLWDLCNPKTLICLEKQEIFKKEKLPLDDDMDSDSDSKDDTKEDKQIRKKTGTKLLRKSSKDHSDRHIENKVYIFK